MNTEKLLQVDDRRVIAEKKIVNLESVVQDLEVKLTKEQKENKRLQVGLFSFFFFHFLQWGGRRNQGSGSRNLQDCECH